MIDLGNEQLSNGLTVRTAISGVLCQTMPSAAIASGMVSPVDFTATLERLTETYANELLARGGFGLSKIQSFLAEKGEVIGEGIVKMWRERIINLALRAAVLAEQQQAV